MTTRHSESWFVFVRRFSDRLVSLIVLIATIPELQTIVMRSANILDVEVDEQGAAEIASRSRGTPRLANRLLKRVRDYAQVKAGTITG